VSVVGGKDHAFAVPVDEIARGGEAKLGVFFVVAGVGEVPSVAEFLEAGIFDAAVFFVRGFGGEHRLGAASEVEAVGAFGVAEAGSAGGALGAVEHDEFAVVKNNGGIEGSGGFPGCALRRKDGFVGSAGPGTEGEVGGGGGEGESPHGSDQNQRGQGEERFLAPQNRPERKKRASLEMTGRAVSAIDDHANSLWRLGGLGRIELLRADDAFTLFDEDDLVGLDVFERFDEAAGPADFEELDGFGFTNAEVDAQIVLRKIAAAAVDFVDLGMETFFAREMRDAFDARADTAAIGFCANGFDFDPVIRGARIATQKLGKSIDGVDDDVEVAVIVEVAESAAARSDRSGDSRTGIVGNIVEAAVTQIFVEQLAL